MQGNNFITISAVIVAIASISYAAGKSGQPTQQQQTSQPVLVTNSTSQPMPVSLYHSIVVPSSQSGTWTVGSAADKNPFEQDNTLQITNGNYQSSAKFTVGLG